MTTQEAINAIYNGGIVKCSSEEYHNGIRSAIQNQAAKWIDQNQSMRAVIALEEIKRLDGVHGLEK
jgi:hypothetical protein